MLTLLKNGWQLYLNVSKSYQIKNQWELVLRGPHPFIILNLFFLRLAKPVSTNEEKGAVTNENS